jgi:hypothetical protein
VSSESPLPVIIIVGALAWAAYSNWRKAAAKRRRPGPVSNETDWSEAARAISDVPAVDIAADLAEVVQQALAKRGFELPSSPESLIEDEPYAFASQDEPAAEELFSPPPYVVQTRRSQSASVPAASVPTSRFDATAQMVRMLSGKSKTKVLAPMSVIQKG